MTDSILSKGTKEDLRASCGQAFDAIHEALKTCYEVLSLEDCLLEPVVQLMIRAETTLAKAISKLDEDKE